MMEMTKRFENRLNQDNVKFNTLNPVWDNQMEDALNVFEMIDLLNSLNDENEQLKHDATVLIQSNQDYRKENEQLKQREKTLEDMIRTFDEGCKEIYDDKCRLEKENEELKQFIDRIYKNFEDRYGMSIENTDWF